MSFKQRLERHPASTFAILSLCWVLLLYWRAFQSPFVYDDLSIIQKNSTILSLHSALGYFGKAVAFSTDFRGPGGAYYRPLTWMSFALDHALWGLWAPGYHLMNLLLHWLNGCLGFLLLRRIGVPALLSCATCLIWLALPVNSEVVVWTSARSHCLAFFFVLLGLLAGWAYVETGRLWALVAYFLAALCALLTHEMGILILPFGFLIAFVRGTWKPGTLSLLCTSGLIAVLATVALRHHAGGTALTLGSVWPVGPSYLHYLGWILFPLKMSIERSTDTPAASFSPGALFLLLALLAIIAAAWAFRRKAPVSAGGVLWAIIALLPVSGLVFLYQGIAERYDYIASAGIVLAVVALYGQLRTPTLQRTFITAAVLWTFAGTARLYARLGDWSSEPRLYRSSLEASPRSWILLLNLGNVYLQSGDLTRAIETYEQALRYNPDAAKAMVNLGAAFEMKGDLPAAEQQFRRALASDPGRADTYSNLGTVLYAEGRIHEAAAVFRKAIELNPGDATSYFNLGLLYAHSGLTEVAAQLYGQALEINPGYTDAQRALTALRKK
jgi:tetratricopeptide (TPR) repeat protein